MIWCLPYGLQLSLQQAAAVSDCRCCSAVDTLHTLVNLMRIPQPQVDVEHNWASGRRLLQAPGPLAPGNADAVRAAAASDPGAPAPALSAADSYQPPGGVPAAVAYFPLQSARPGTLNAQPALGDAVPCMQQVSDFHGLTHWLQMGRLSVLCRGAAPWATCSTAATSQRTRSWAALS